MKNSLLFLFVITSFAYVIQSCSASSDTVIIAGQVIEASSGNAVNNAIVEVTQPDNLQQTATTDSAGNFSFDVDPGSETVNITLEISKQAYQSTTTSFKLAPETNVDDLTIELQSSDNSGGGGDGSGGNEVGGEASGPASIILESISSQTINVAETGGIANTAFTFVVEDSAGRTVGQNYEVQFEIIRGPDGGESLTPSTAETNSNGEVTSNLFSGDSSGTVRIEARIERPNYNLTIRSTPVLISISGGFPVLENFNVGPRVYNFDGYGFIDESHTNSITASLGDLKGNPVKEGTAVYFSSSNGGLVNGSAATNENGYATVNLSANGSTPTGHPMGQGFIDVTAQTVDKDNNYIERKMTMLLTTPQAIINVSPTTFNIANGGSQTFDVTITDRNGYPMAANTNISVSTSGGLSASGSITGMQLGDYFQPGPGTTNFSVTISDATPTRDDGNTNGSFTIIVEAPSGLTTTRDIKGTRSKIK